MIGFFLLVCGYVKNLKRHEIIPKEKTLIVLPISFFIILCKSFFFYRHMINSNVLNSLFGAIGIQNKLGVVLLTICSAIVAFAFAYYLVGSIVSNEMLDHYICRIRLKKTVMIPLGLLIVSSVFLLVYSYNSPFKSEISGGDYSIFYIIGKAWTSGKIPYIEIFDHKGPFIFLVYLVGILINEKWGICLLETIAIGISLIFVYKLAVWEKKISVFGVIAVLVTIWYMQMLYVGQALTEEFCLPFLVISTYLSNEYLCHCEDKREHPPWFACFYGITFAVCFCTRVTNAAAICVYVASILVYLIYNKKIKNIFLNAIAFIGGTAVVCVPFMIYFAMNGALYDMFWGTLLFNLHYSQNGRMDITFSNVIYMICLLMPLWLLIGTVLLKKIKRVILVPNILAILAVTVVITSGYLFAHYYIILIPFIPLSIRWIEELLEEQKKAVHEKRLIICLLWITLIPWGITGTGVIANMDNTQVTLYEECALEIVENIPKDERDSVIGYNTDSLFYLHTELLPCYKYYTLQDFQSSASEVMKNENIEYYKSKAARWVVVQGEIEIEAVRESINENYVLYEQISYGTTAGQRLSLYKVRE